MAHLRSIVLKIQRTVRIRVEEAGRRRASAMLEAYGRDPAGVFSWAPEMRRWLRTASYVLFLGVQELNR
jgi:hypothetical protein